MKVKILFWSLAIAIGLGVTASAQSDSKLKVPTTTPKQDAGNPAKLPPTVKQLFIPDLRLKGAESVAVDATVPKRDRKSTRLNSSHSQISYAVFCLKKKKKK